MVDRVYGISADFGDRENNRGACAFNVKASSIEDCISQAQSKLSQLQAASECMLVQAFAIADIPFTPLHTTLDGHVRKELMIFCYTVADPVQNKAYVFKLRVPSPDPAILNIGETELNKDSGPGRVFYENFVVPSRDVRGLLFSNMIKSQVIVIP